ncbi:MAG: hypothetical protein ACLQVI_13445 [Polyangiaceae bacterium]|jgi:hypothetical protein
MRSLRSAWVALGALVALIALRAASTPAWPDDWDGVGFVEAVTRFDLDHFIPHPPGYPVYVALLRAARLFTHDPTLAANAVAVSAGVAAIVLLTLATARVLGWGRAAWLGVFVAIVPLVWRTSTAIGSEAPALAFASAAVFGGTRTRRSASWWIGLSVGLGLGARLSWAPLLLPLLALAPRGARFRTLLVASAATLAWCAPFIAVVGAKHLVALARTHAIGHFQVWGGSALSEPGLERFVWLARDVFVDGLGIDRDPVGIAIGATSLVLAGLGWSAWRANDSSRRAAFARPLLVLVPYLAWIALGQNLHHQPRHALPIVVAVAGVLALAASTSSRARAAGALLFVLVAARTVIDAHSRRTIAPPGEQLVALADSLPAGVTVFGGPSVRFFELEPQPHVAGINVGTLGDVRLALGRLSPLPSRVLVTSEVEGLSLSSYPLVHVATLCRPERIERRAPCIDVLDWKAPFLRR